LQERGVQEDISGASLQTTWLHFRRDEGDRLVSAPPGMTSSEALSIELPPLPSAIPTRARTTTVRRRRRTGPKYAALAIAVAGLVILVAAFLSQGEKVVESDPHPVETVAARHETAPVLAPPPTPSPPTPATHTEADLGSRVAVDPSALPVAKEEQPVAPKPRHDRPRRSSTTRNGITVKDPYATSTKTTLKNPF
jgi:hypothetical protein